MPRYTATVRRRVVIYEAATVSINAPGFEEALGRLRSHEEFPWSEVRDERDPGDVEFTSLAETGDGA